MTVGATQLAPGVDANIWEWPIPIAARTAILKVNIMQFVQSINGTLFVNMAVNGSITGVGTTSIAGVGVFSVSGAVTLSVNNTVGIVLSTGGAGTIQLVMTAYLELTAP